MHGLRRERYISTRLNWGKNILEYGKTVAFSFNFFPKKPQTNKPKTHCLLTPNFWMVWCLRVLSSDAYTHCTQNTFFKRMIYDPLIYSHNHLLRNLFRSLPNRVCSGYLQVEKESFKVNCLILFLCNNLITRHKGNVKTASKWVQMLGCKSWREIRGAKKTRSSRLWAVFKDEAVRVCFISHLDKHLFSRKQNGSFTQHFNVLMCIKCFLSYLQYIYFLIFSCFD